MSRCGALSQQNGAVSRIDFVPKVKVVASPVIEQLTVVQFAIVSTPGRLVLCGVYTAVAIAGLIITTESAVVEKPEEESEPAGAGGHGHMH